MGIKLRIFFVRILLLLSFTSMLAQEQTPPPPNRAGAPAPFGLPMPIDENVFVLVILGVVLGVYFLYKKKKQALS